jgi:hypothetical protein
LTEAQLLYAAADAFYGRLAFIAMYWDAVLRPGSGSSERGRLGGGASRSDTDPTCSTYRDKCGEPVLAELRQWLGGAVGQKVTGALGEEPQNGSTPIGKSTSASVSTPCSTRATASTSTTTTTTTINTRSSNCTSRCLPKNRKDNEVSPNTSLVQSWEREQLRQQLLLAYHTRAWGLPAGVMDLTQAFPSVRVSASSIAPRSGLRASAHHSARVVVDGNCPLRMIALPALVVQRDWHEASCWHSGRSPRHVLRFDFPVPVVVQAYSLRARPDHACRGDMPRCWTLQARQSAAHSWVSLHKVSDQPVWTYPLGFGSDTLPGEARVFAIEEGSAGEEAAATTTTINTSSANSGVDPRLYEWQYKDMNKWHPYEAGTQAILEEGYTRGGPTDPVRVQVERKHSIREYDVDVWTGHQTSVTTGFVRPVRRVARAAALAFSTSADPANAGERNAGSTSHSHIDPAAAPAPRGYISYRFVFAKSAHERQKGSFSVKVNQVELLGPLPACVLAVPANPNKAPQTHGLPRALPALHSAEGAGCFPSPSRTPPLRLAAGTDAGASPTDHNLSNYILLPGRTAANGIAAAATEGVDGAAEACRGERTSEFNACTPLAPLFDSLLGPTVRSA